MKNAMKKVALFATALILFGCASDDEPEVVISGASPTTTTKVNENGLPIAKEPTSITETMLHTVVQMQVYHEGRSEERRVGKESRSRWWTGVRQKKTRKREKYEKIGNDKTR